MAPKQRSSPKQQTAEVEHDTSRGSKRHAEDIERETSHRSQNEPDEATDLEPMPPEDRRSELSPDDLE